MRSRSWLVLAWMVLAVALLGPHSAPAQICNMASVSPSTGNAPLTVHFAAPPVQGCDRNKDKQFWILDGQPEGNSLSWSRTLEEPGDYSWEFCSWLPGCIQCCDGGTIRVTRPGCQLDCSVSVTERPDGPPLVVDFAATVTPRFCPSGTLTYEWKFGDLQESSQQNPRHEYIGTGPYYWNFIARYGAFSCSKQGTVALDCLRIGNLRLCGDQIENEPGSELYRFSGNVNINQSLWFTGTVLYQGRPEGALGSLVTSGSLYVKLRNRNAQLVSGESLAFEVRGDENVLHALPGNPDYYVFDLGGLRLPIVGEKPITVGSDNVKLATLAWVGIPGVLDLARLEAEVTFVNGGDADLTRFEGVAGSATPSISFVEITGTYDPRQNKLDMRTVCRFPFSGGASFQGRFGFESCGPNSADLTLGGVFEKGISITPPVLPVKLKAGRDLVIRAEHFCDRFPFLIYLGTRATLCIDVGIDCISIPGEFFRISDLGAGYQHPLNFDIRGGTPTVLGYPVASARGKIQGNQPPYGVFVRGMANLGGFINGIIDAAMSFSRFKLIGSIGGTLQVPNFRCSPNNAPCKVLKNVFKRLAGPLPAQFGNVAMEIDGKGSLETLDVWSGTARGRFEVGGVGLVGLIQFGPEGATLQVGTNYANLYSFLESGPLIRRGVELERRAVIASPATDVVFGFIGSAGPPSAYLITPTGQTITPESVNAMPGAFYSTDDEERTSAFFLPAVAAGNWTLGASSPAGDVSFHVLGPVPPPVVEFDDVRHEGESVRIHAHVAPAGEDAEVEVLYSRSSGAGLTESIPSTYRSDTGELSAVWDVSGLSSDTYFISVRADDGRNPPTTATWPQPIAIDRGEMVPPRNLSGRRSGGEATFRWTASPASGVVGYNLLYSEASDPAGYLYSATVPYGVEGTVANLDADRTYRFVVVAYDAQNRYSLPSNEVVLAPPSAACTGDCNGDGQVTIDELIRGVNIALGMAVLGSCPAFDRNSDGAVTVDELVLAVNRALGGCPVISPTPTVTRTVTSSVVTITATTTPNGTRTLTATATRTGTPTVIGPSRTATRTPVPTVATATPTPTPTGVPEVYCSDIGSPIEIPDNDPFGIASTIVVNQSRIIGGLSITLWIEHTWVGDIVVSLTRLQDLTTVTLIDRPGHPAAMFGCPADDMICEITDTATFFAEDQCSSQPPALWGALKPHSPLATFNGENLLGAWMLAVSDVSASDTGRLIQWCIQARTNP